MQIMANKFWCKYLVQCIEINILHTFSFLRKLDHVIFFSHFYFFRNGLRGLVTASGLIFLSENMVFCIEDWI